MELTFTFDASNSLLRAALIGPYSLANAQTTFLAILDAVVLYQAKKVLIDCSAITGQPTTWERFDYSKFVAEESYKMSSRGLARCPKYAYIILPPVVDPQLFGETVAVNRGLTIKVFDSVSKAEHWLLEDISLAERGITESHA